MDKSDVLSALARATGKFCMHLSWERDDEIDKILNSITWLRDIQYGQVMVEGEAVFVFDTEEEMNACFDQIECDYPTPDKVPVLAITCSAGGIILNQNT